MKIELKEGTVVKVDHVKVGQIYNGQTIMCVEGYSFVTEDYRIHSSPCNVVTSGLNYYLDELLELNGKTVELINDQYVCNDIAIGCITWEQVTDTLEVGDRNGDFTIVEKLYDICAVYNDKFSGLIKESDVTGWERLLR